MLGPAILKRCSCARQVSFSLRIWDMESCLFHENPGVATCIFKHLKLRPYCSCLWSYAGSCLWYPGVRAADCEQTARSVARYIQTAAHLCEPPFKFPKSESSPSGPGHRWIALLRLQLVNPSTSTEANKSEREPKRWHECSRRRVRNVQFFWHLQEMKVAGPRGHVSCPSQFLRRFHFPTVLIHPSEKNKWALLLATSKCKAGVPNT